MATDGSNVSKPCQDCVKYDSQQVLHFLNCSWFRYLEAALDVSYDIYQCFIVSRSDDSLEPVLDLCNLLLSIALVVVSVTDGLDVSKQSYMHTTCCLQLLLPVW